METRGGILTFHAKSREDWRKWLEENHQSVQSVWLIIYRKESGIPTVYYPEAVDEALCFGWIDSKGNKRDDKSYYQFFSKRNTKSNWSKASKDKVTNLIDEGRMTVAGQALIGIAKENGAWTALDEVEDIIIPNDMQMLFDVNKTALDNWGQFSRSSKRGILEWILNAKRPETRRKRIEETVKLAEMNVKANQYNPK